MSTDVSEVRAASIIRAIIALMMEAARSSETSVDNYFTRQYIPQDKSELHTRRRENLKSHTNNSDIYFRPISMFTIHGVAMKQSPSCETRGCL